MKKINQNKTAKLISMTTATVLITLILASSLYLDGTITANAVSEENFKDSSRLIAPSIKEINFNELFIK